MSARLRTRIASTGVAAAGAAAFAASALAAGHVAKPTIASFTPMTAKPAAAVTLTGTNLTGAKTVKVDGMAATFKVLSDKSITVTLPSKAKSGKIAVTTAGGTATSAASLKIS